MLPRLNFLKYPMRLYSRTKMIFYVVGSGSLLGLYYIIQKPDEARAQLAPKPMGLIAINTLTYNCGHIAWPDGL